MEKQEISILKNNDKELVNQHKSSEIILFLSLWEEETGFSVVDYCPKSYLGDLNSLTTRIFSALKFLYLDPEEKYSSRKLTLPIVSLNRKASVLFEVIYNPEVQGGLQPFILVLLVPDYFLDEKLALFDALMLKVAKKYINEQKIIIKEVYREIEELYIKEHDIQESSFEINENYSYSAAINDFRAGVELFKTHNYDDAYQVLRKALMKFEHDNQKTLIMEVLYLIASLFAQKKDYAIAEKYYLRLEYLAELLEHQKYSEVSKFMSGFCAYKNERHIETIKQFSKLELFKKNYINEFQYYTVYGRALEKLQNYEEAIKKLKFSLGIIERMENSVQNKKQRGQIKYELGLLLFKQEMMSIKKKGIQEQKKDFEFLNEAITFFEESSNIWIEIGDQTKLFNTFRLVGDIYEFQGDETNFFEYYNKALECAERNQDILNQINVLKRIIQKQAVLGKNKENIERLREVIHKFDNFALIDLYTKARFHKLLGISLIEVNQLNEGLSELIKAYEILDKFKNPVDDEIQILNVIIALIDKKGDNEEVDLYKEKLHLVSEKLEQKKTERTKVMTILTFIKDIWFFSKSIGVEIFNYSPEIGVETDLLGGFMTAMQSMSQELAYNRIESIIYGDDRFTIYQEENRDFYIIARSKVIISEETVNNILSTIYNRFWKEYSEEITNFGGNIVPFQKFNGILESFDWTLVSKKEEQKTRGMKEKISEMVEDLKKM
jgi:tetratricopeptide (TPR) repeat protein